MGEAIIGAKNSYILKKNSSSTEQVRLWANVFSVR